MENLLNWQQVKIISKLLFMEMTSEHVDITNLLSSDLNNVFRTSLSNHRNSYCDLISKPSGDGSLIKILFCRGSPKRSATQGEVHHSPDRYELSQTHLSVSSLDVGAQ